MNGARVPFHAQIERRLTVYDQGEGAERLIIGGGQYGRVELSPEAAAYLAGKQCDVVLVPTPEVIATWNEAKGKVIGLFHVTC